MSPRWLDEFFTHAPAAMALLRGDGHVVELANPAFWELIGSGSGAPGEPLGAIANVLGDGFLERLDQVRAAGQTCREEEVPLVRVADGERVGAFVDLVYLPLLDAPADPDAVVVLAVDVTERVRHRQEAERSLAVLSSQKEVLERIVRGDPLPSVLDALVRMVERRSLDEVLASVLLVDDDGSHLRHGAAPSLPDFYNEAIDGLATGPSAGSCGTAAFRGERVVVADIATDPLWRDFRDLARRAGLGACWSTPILDAGGEVLGTFAMYYRHPRPPREDELAVIDVWAQTAAVAIARCRADGDRERALAEEHAARAELEQAHADLNLVLEATTRMTSTLDYDDTLGALADMAVPVLADVCLIDVVEDGALRRAVAVAHRPEHRVLTADLARFAPEPGGSHPAAEVVTTGRPQFAPEMSEEFLRSTCRDDEHFQTVRLLGFESYITVPLAARGNVLGALTLVSAGSGRRYGPHDLVVTEELARRAALAIDNSRLYRSARNAEQRLSLVARTGAALTASLDLDTVVERLGTLLVGEVGDRCEIHVCDLAGRWRRAVHDEHGSTVAAVAGLPPGIERSVRAGTAVYLGGEAAGFEGVFSGGAEGFASAVVVPLFARGETIGAIALGVRPDERRARLDPEIIEVLAGRAALAVDNARRFEHERSVAEVFQRSILPRHLPVVAGITTAARYQPGSPHTEVGGDWFDVMPYADGRVAVAMGDVMGRGIPAASAMAQLRNALRMLAIQQHPPGAALSWLNRLLAGADDPPLATLFFAVVDPTTGVATVANAGHCPPLLVHGPYVSYLPGATDPPLGVTAAGTYREDTVAFASGSTLVLYTDGLIERRDRCLADGLAALADAARTGDATDPDRLCDHLLAALLSPDHEEDDTALLAVHFGLPVTG